MTVFFKGTVKEKVEAVFETLDADGDGSLSKSEMQEYLKPYVYAMTPVEASSLRPLLLSWVTNDLFTDMDIDDDGRVNSWELVTWSERGNDIVHRVAAIIDHELFKDRSAEGVPGPSLAQRTCSHVARCGSCRHLLCVAWG